VDIGFSDALSSRAEPVEYPNILSGLKPVQLKSYPKEAVVAEKFHAMVRHAELNSRMKDYYDLWLLAETFAFEGRSLQEAIETTFRQRATELPSERPVSLSTEFADSNHGRWMNFLKKMNLEMMESDAFSSVVDQIWKFLESPLQSSLQGTKSNHHWSPQKGWK
jgi:hypothetical protein